MIFFLILKNEKIQIIQDALDDLSMNWMHLKNYENSIIVIYQNKLMIFKPIVIIFTLKVFFISK